MNYQELKSKFEPSPNGTTFSVEASTFPGSGVERLLKKFFDDDKLVTDLANAIPNDEDEVITLTGKLANAFLGIQKTTTLNIEINATFFLLDDDPQINISLGIVKEWPLPEVIAESAFSALGSGLNLDFENKLPFPVKEIYLESNLETLSVSVAPEQSTSFSELPELLNGTEVAPEFPNGEFPSFETGLSLDNFSISGIIQPMELTSVSADLSLSGGKSWRPFGDLIKFENLSANLLLINPLENPEVSAEALATALIGGVGIAATISLPSKRFSLFLQEGELINIKTFLEELVSTNIPMPEMKCTELGILGDPENHTFELFATLEDVMELDLGISVLKINRIEGDFIHTSKPVAETGGHLEGFASFGNIEIFVSAENTPGETGWQYSGSLTNIEIGKFFGELSKSFGAVRVPNVLEGITIDQVFVTFNTATKNFFFNLAMSMTIDDKEIDLNFTIDLEKQGRSYTKRFGGTAQIGDITLDLQLSKSANSTSLLASFDAPEGFRINPLEDLVKQLTTDPGFDFGEGFGLTSIQIFHLEFNFDTLKNNGTVTKTYAFQGEAKWIPEIAALTDLNLEIGAEVDISKTVTKIGTSAPTRTTEGFVKGILQMNIPLFEHLEISAIYDIAPASKGLRFEVVLGKLVVLLEIKKEGGKKIFKAKPDGLTFGEVISFMVSLVDPGEDDFTLDPPWDALNKISLSDFVLEINITDKAVKITYSNGFSLGFMEITAFSLVYGASASGKEKGVTLDISGSLFGKEIPPWDVLNEAPPEVAGQGSSFFELRYLGIGQHIALDQATLVEATNISLILDALAGKALPLPRGEGNQNPLKGSSLQFNGDAGWLIGASFTLLKAFDVKVIFNDPFIYGLRIELFGDLAKVLKGLMFEILYRRISDTVGVYHVELALPAAFRQLEFGAVSITIPVIVLDIFTNGDFKVDVGFPWKGNWERSLGVQVFPFTGSAGFYFNKLSAETATSTPIITNGKFTPVLEFGFGLKIGLGKSFNKGPLRAEISITVQGILQGVISWFNPDDVADEKETFFLLSGSVAIVGRVYGAVDFVVIRVEVEIIVRVSVSFVFEVYQPIFLVIEAEVSVKASLKVLFVTVKFSFSLTITQEFTIGEPQPTPWILAADQSARKQVSGSGGTGFLLASFITAALGTSGSASSGEKLAQRLADILLDKTPQTTPLSWQNVGIWKEGKKEQIDIFFEPIFTKDKDGMKGVAMLFIENSIDITKNGSGSFEADAENDTDFDKLLQGLLVWAIYAYHAQPLNEDGTKPPVDTEKMSEISLADLELLFDEFVNDIEDKKAPFDFTRLIAFLERNFEFRLSKDNRAKNSGKGISGTGFPMFPQLSLTMTDGAQNTNISFSAPKFVLDKDDLKRYDNHFRKLKVEHGSTVETDVSSSASTILDNIESQPVSVFVFLDYFALLIRMGVQSAIDHLKKTELTSIGVVPLLEALNGNGQFNHIAGMASRFLMHGLRLPENVTGSAATVPTSPVYKETGQQFTMTVTEAGDPKVKTIHPQSVALANPGGASLINFGFKAGAKPEDPLVPITSLSFPFTKPFIDEFTKINAETPNLTIKLKQDIPLYKEVPDRISLGKLIPWKASLGANLLGLPVTNPADPIPIFELPKTLQDFLDDKPDGLDVKFTKGVKIKGSKKLDFQPFTAYKLATKVDFLVQRIPAKDGELLPDIFLLDSLTESGNEVLEDLFKKIDAYELVLHLLYASVDAEGVENHQPQSCQLIKTNLSNHFGDPAAPGVVYSAGLSETRQFIRLIWEGSTLQTGGFLLQFNYKDAADGDKIKSLPEKLFQGSNPATISLLIRYKAKAGSPSLTMAFPFHNCLILTEKLEMDKTLSLFAETGIQQKVLAIPPGNIGIRFHRDDPFEKNIERKLENLYQLLAYQVVNNTSFKGSIESLPIGPVEDDSEIGALADTWIYEKVIPVFPFAVNNDLKGNDNLFLKASNPYAGIGSADEFEVNFFWQDIFGNRLKTTRAFSETRTIRYYDPIIGINQWPSVIEHFEFEKSGSDKVKLIISLSLDQDAFIPGNGKIFNEVRKKTQVARSTFEKVYYQLHQNDLKFGIKTSVLPDFNKTLTEKNDKQFITGFVESAYKFLVTLESLVPFVPPTGIDHSFEKFSNEFFINIHALANENRKVKGIYPAGTDLKNPLKDKQSIYRTKEGETLESILVEMQKIDDEKALNFAAIAELNKTIAFSSFAFDVITSESPFIIPGRVNVSGTPTSVVTVLANQSPADVVKVINDDLAIGSITVEDLITANQSLNGILTENIAIKISDSLEVKTRVNETLSSLLDLANVDVTNPAKRISFRVLAAKIKVVKGIFPANIKLIKPPVNVQEPFETAIKSDTGFLYPADLTFPVTVKMETTRDNNLIDPNVPLDVTEVQSVSANLSPKLITSNLKGEEKEKESLQEFASKFQIAFPGLHLAVGEERRRNNPEATGDPDELNKMIWAVQIGGNGIAYSIIKSIPSFYAMAPLATTLFSGEVPVKSYVSGTGLVDAAEKKGFNDIDLNVLGRSFLQSIEDFLEPDMIIPAVKKDPDIAKAIIASKELLAKAIERQLILILDKAEGTGLGAARGTLLQKLLVNLVEGFDIETVIQYSVNVSLNGKSWPVSERVPRLSGQPVIKPVLGQDGNHFDFNLSPATIPLEEGGSFLTFLFDTKTPEKFEDVILDLEFKVNDLEHQIVKQEIGSLGSHFDSSFLKFILAVDGANAGNQFGTLEVPIPLRNYPLPPSLILQAAEEDPDSRKIIEKIREWQYVFTYEHPEVAQDAIKCEVKYNVKDVEKIAKSQSVDQNRKSLFEALINFSTLYPSILNDLELLKKTPDNTVVAPALVGFKSLVDAVTSAWTAYTSELVTSRSKAKLTLSDSHKADYIINETHKDDQIVVDIVKREPTNPMSLPDVIIPRFAKDDLGSADLSKDTEVSFTFTEKSPEDAALDPVFGESSIPDRTLIIRDLDVINQQNAWGGIWLTRNEDLLSGAKTNPEFIFRTPIVRFTNAITPFLVNDVEMDIGSISRKKSVTLPISLLDHLKALFEVLHTPKPERAFELQISCSYSFAIAKGEGFNKDLFVSLPVLLGLRVDNATKPEVFEAYLGRLAKMIKDWRDEALPSRENASFLFGVLFFSKLDPANQSNVPILNIEQLRLKENEIKWD